LDVEETWRKANPNYGVSVEPEHLAMPVPQGDAIAGFASSFLTKHLNIWIQTDQALFDMRAWEPLQG
jgi:phage terminase large subunit-like protein